MLRAGMVAACLFAAVAARFACNRPDAGGRMALGGTVSCGGQPIESGAILFEPGSGERSEAGGLIAHGRFWIPAAQGAYPGEYLVRVYAASTAQAAPAAGQSERASRPMVDRVPERYNAKSSLTIRLGPDNARDLRFDLECETEAPAP